jgi:hypothetical protein
MAEQESARRNPAARHNNGINLSDAQDRFVIWHTHAFVIWITRTLASQSNSPIALRDHLFCANAYRGARVV